MTEPEIIRVGKHFTLSSRTYYGFLEKSEMPVGVAIFVRSNNEPKGEWGIWIRVIPFKSMVPFTRVEIPWAKPFQNRLRGGIDEGLRALEMADADKENNIRLQEEFRQEKARYEKYAVSAVHDVKAAIAQDSPTKEIV